MSGLVDLHLVSHGLGHVDSLEREQVQHEDGNVGQLLGVVPSGR